MRKVAFLSLATALVSASISARSAVASPTATPSVSQPSLIQDVTVRAEDSALVRAAKNAVANRLREASRSTGVLINDAYIRSSTGRISQATGSAPLPQFNDRSQTVGRATTGLTTPNKPATDRPAMQYQQPVVRPEQVTADPSAPRTSQNTTGIPNNDYRPNPRP